MSKVDFYFLPKADHIQDFMKHLKWIAEAKAQVEELLASMKAEERSVVMEQIAKINELIKRDQMRRAKEMRTRLEMSRWRLKPYPERDMRRIQTTTMR